ncbi:ferrous iron transporter B [Heliorestis acidaminivorans]|uniref:Ferrous iron transporter B n=1 Tax=Heliorestis acidaminivorans TaxID=553427 RepID=A0A6I0EPG5_9FIRM|nr:ferrous iron transporter B [Heliorestis acidaminivorans]KAB2951808.1 ferrous iron transporter B [Heliorestis acidaminivorans]
MDCHSQEELLLPVRADEIRVLLMGNPNVGKSVVFSKLTNKEVLSANYTGTTVGFTSGKTEYRGQVISLIDVPGTYSLESTSPAEEVAINMLGEGAHLILCVLDGTNLERNLNLALQLKQCDIPIVFAVNFLDIAEREGISIDTTALARELDAPVLPIIAIRNQGLQEVLDQVVKTASIELKSCKPDGKPQKEQWQEISRIVDKVLRVEERQPTFRQRLGDWMLRPMPGLPIALLVLLVALGLVVGGGKALRAVFFLPVTHDLIVPAIKSFVALFVTEGLLFNILVGEYGVLVKMIEWPFALILPYIFLFYIVLAFMEDSGYMPRLGVLLDRTLRSMGLQGGNVVPLFMGYGCAVPAILGTRAATTYKERLIVATLVSLAIPCASQTGAFVALLGERSITVLILMLIISFGALVVAGNIMGRIIPGKIDPMLLEIPNLLLPDRKAITRKIWLRTKNFMVDAQLPLFFGIALAALMVETGALEVFGEYIKPLVSGWMGLPPEASLALVLGIIRRELGVLPLLEMDLTTLQLLVGSVVALFYVPCLAVFGVLFKEFGVKVAVYIVVLTITSAFFFAGLINQVGSLLLGFF